MLRWIAIFFFILVSATTNLRAESVMTRIHEKTINFAFGGQVGVENGTIFRLEYEDNRKGKLMASGLAGVYLKRDNYIFIDAGLGFGYPLQHTYRYAFYLNSHITWMHLLPYPDEEAVRRGPSGVLEAEWRYSWKPVSLHALLGNRMHFALVNKLEPPTDYSWFLRVGLVFRIGETGIPQ